MTRDEEPHIFYPVREPVGPLPWEIELYGYSVANVRDAHGQVVLSELNIAVAEFIVEKMNRP